jgi:hypothetical protein
LLSSPGVQQVFSSEEEEYQSLKNNKGRNVSSVVEIPTPEPLKDNSLPSSVDLFDDSQDKIPKMRIGRLRKQNKLNLISQDIPSSIPSSLKPSEPVLTDVVKELEVEQQNDEKKKLLKRSRVVMVLTPEKTPEHSPRNLPEHTQIQVDSEEEEDLDFPESKRCRKDIPFEIVE